MSISGLHFALITAALFILLLVAGVKPKAAAFLSLVLLSAYVFLAGFSVPVQRAGFVAAAGMFGVILERDVRGFHTFFSAVGLFLLSDTRLFGNISFQLSFLSVFCMLWAAKTVQHPQSLWEGVGVSLAVAAGTFPITALVFHGFSLTGIPANLIAVPLFNAALLFSFPALFFYGIKLTFLASAAAGAAKFFLTAGLSTVVWFSNIPGSYLFVKTPAFTALAAYSFFCAGGAFLEISPLENKKILRVFFAAGWGVSALAIFFPDRPKEPSVTVLEARSYPLAHVHFAKDRDWIFSAPGASWGQDDTWVLRPYLQGEGCRKIERLVFLSERAKNKRPFTTGFPSMARPANGAGFSETFPPELKGGSRVIFNSGSRGFETLGGPANRAPVRLWMEEFQMLIIPSLNGDNLQRILSFEEWGGDSQVVFLPALTESNKRHLSALLERCDPEAVILPKAPNAQILPARSGVPRIFFLDQTGAIRLESLMDGKPRLQRAAF